MTNALIVDPGAQFSQSGISGFFEVLKAVVFDYTSAIGKNTLPKNPPIPLDVMRNIISGGNPSKPISSFFAKFKPLTPIDILVAKTILPILLKQCLGSKGRRQAEQLTPVQIQNLIVEISPELEPAIEELLRSHYFKSSEPTDPSLSEDSLAQQILFPQLIAKELSLEPSLWDPQSDFKRLQLMLANQGPMVVRGAFGDAFFTEPPVELEQSIGDSSIWTWPEDPPSTSNHTPNYALVVGAVANLQSHHQIEEVVFLRPSDGSNRLYEIPYESFRKRVVPLNHIPTGLENDIFHTYGWQTRFN